MEKRKSVSYSRENAFHALGLEDADDLMLRAELMRRIAGIVATRRLTQIQAGTLMGMDQPRVSALLSGKISKFSTDRLLKALSGLGHNVELRITPARTKVGRLTVAASRSLGHGKSRRRSPKILSSDDAPYLGAGELSALVKKGVARVVRNKGRMLKNGSPSKNKTG